MLVSVRNVGIQTLGNLSDSGTEEVGKTFTSSSFTTTEKKWGFLPWWERTVSVSLVRVSASET